MDNQNKEIEKEYQEKMKEKALRKMYDWHCKKFGYISYEEFLKEYSVLVNH